MPSAEDTGFSETQWVLKPGVSKLDATWARIAAAAAAESGRGAAAVSGNPDGVRASLTPDIEAAATATELFPRLLAQGYAARMPDRALYWLEIAIARGFINYPFLARYDPFLACLRAEPRFQQLMVVARGRWERFKPAG